MTRTTLWAGSNSTQPSLISTAMWRQWWLRKQTPLQQSMPKKGTINVLLTKQATTFITPIGRFKFVRACTIWNHINNRALQLPNGCSICLVRHAVDDIVINDSDKTQHNSYQYIHPKHNIYHPLLPLCPLLSMKNEFMWSEEFYQVFKTIITPLVSASMLPYFHLSKLTRLCTDASRQGLGFILQWKNGDTWSTI